MEVTKLIVVYPAALLGWEVLAPGCEQPKEFIDRPAAIDFARSIAETNRPCKVQIEDWYGHIECEWMFAVDHAISAEPL